MSRRRSPRASSLAFPSLARERQQAQSLFSIDIEASFRDWMEQLGGNPDVLAHAAPVEPDFERKLDLTRRERQSLSLYACGYSKREVGEILGIGMESVKQYCKRCQQKFGTANLTHAALVAALVGELDLELLQEHLFRQWELPGLAAPRTPIAA